MGRTCKGETDVQGIRDATHADHKASNDQVANGTMATKSTRAQPDQGVGHHGWSLQGPLAEGPCRRPIIAGVASTWQWNERGPRSTNEPFMSFDRQYLS